MKPSAPASEKILGDTSSAPEEFDATYCLYTWNQAAFVEEAVNSALGQQHCRLEIIISDDVSSDDTFQRILATVDGYSGPHRVIVRRNARNHGIDHFPALVKAASRDILIHAHGDDVAESNRAHAILSALNRTGASVVSTNATSIDAKGHGKKKLVDADQDRWFTSEDLIEEPFRWEMTGALLAIRREVYDQFPWLDSEWLARGHDHVVPWRGTLLNGFYWIGEPLLRHRKHANQWRYRFYDDSTPDTRRETFLVHLLSVCRARQRDIDHLLSSGNEVPRSRLVAIREALDARTAYIYDNWLDLHDRLIRQGLRPVWESDKIPRRRKHGAATIAGRLMGRLLNR